VEWKDGTTSCVPLSTLKDALGLFPLSSLQCWQRASS
jgi:hypothetical protein